jgi:hypothetical protein
MGNSQIADHGFSHFLVLHHKGVLVSVSQSNAPPPAFFKSQKLFTCLLNFILLYRLAEGKLLIHYLKLWQILLETYLSILLEEGTNHLSIV